MREVVFVQHRNLQEYLGDNHGLFLLGEDYFGVESAFEIVFEILPGENPFKLLVFHSARNEEVGKVYGLKLLVVEFQVLLDLLDVVFKLHVLSGEVDFLEDVDLVHFVMELQAVEQSVSLFVIGAFQQGEVLLGFVILNILNHLFVTHYSFYPFRNWYFEVI